MIASVIANVNRGPRQRPVSPEDFVLRFEAPPEPEETDPFAAIAKD